MKRFTAPLFALLTSTALLTGCTSESTPLDNFDQPSGPEAKELTKKYREIFAELKKEDPDYQLVGIGFSNYADEKIIEPFFQTKSGLKIYQITDDGYSLVKEEENEIPFDTYPYNPADTEINEEAYDSAGKRTSCPEPESRRTLLTHMNNSELIGSYCGTFDGKLDDPLISGSYVGTDNNEPKASDKARAIEKTAALLPQIGEIAQSDIFTVISSNENLELILYRDNVENEIKSIYELPNMFSTNWSHPQLIFGHEGDTYKETMTPDELSAPVLTRAMLFGNPLQERDKEYKIYSKDGSIVVEGSNGNKSELMGSTERDLIKKSNSK